jgi:hypothetical protein
MAVIINSTASWSPSQLQKGVPLDSNNPGNSALQAMVDAENRAWLASKNYLFAFNCLPGFSSLNPNLTRDVFRFRAHNPVGLINLRFQVRGVYAGGTGAQLALKDNGLIIAAVNLSTTTTTQTAIGPVGGLGDRTYTIEVKTNPGSTVQFTLIWVSWNDTI